MCNNSRRKNEHALLLRLQELPHAVYCRIVANVIESANVTAPTYYRTIKGESTNLQVIEAIARFLNCKIEDVINPYYKFQDPRPKKGKQINIVEELKLSKPQK